MKKKDKKFDLEKYSFYLGALILGYGLLVVAYYSLPDFLVLMAFGKNVHETIVTFQIGMWAPFFCAMGDLAYHRKNQKQMMKFLYEQDLLAGDPDTILGPRDLGKILRAARESHEKPNAYPSRVIHQVVLKYQAAKSVDQASTMLSSLVDLYAHRLDLGLAFVRYICWLLPSLGFIGTVYGISLAVTSVGSASADDPDLLRKLTEELSGGFDTTLVALVLSSLLLFLVHKLEHADEIFVNDLGSYVQEQLINRLE